MSRGLTDPTEPEEAVEGPTVKDLDDAMREAYDNIYLLAVRLEVIEDLLRNKLDQALPEVAEEEKPKKKWLKGT